MTNSEIYSALMDYVISASKLPENKLIISGIMQEVKEIHIRNPLEYPSRIIQMRRTLMGILPYVGHEHYQAQFNQLSIVLQACRNEMHLIDVQPSYHKIID
jgi:hypothetical protein